MKRLVTITLTLFLFAVSNIFAQSADVDVNVTIQGSLSIVQQADVQFGTVQAGETHLISNTESPGNLGRVYITGQGSTLVYIDTEGTVELTPNTPGPDPFSATMAYFGGTTDDGSTSTPLTASETLTAGGEFYVFVGATISPPNTQANGSYSGTTTISVSYSSF